MTKEQAEKVGFKCYEDGWNMPCLYGHYLRYVKNDECAECTPEQRKEDTQHRIRAAFQTVSIR